MATWAQPSPAGKPKAEVALVSSVEAVVPGEPFDLGVHFQLQPEWHIYWKDPGDSGLPPSIEWRLPQGFAVGDLMFPIPRRHVSGGGLITTNIIEGEPLLPIQVLPPESIEADRIRIEGDLVYLVCSTQCLRETARLSIELPVTAPGSKPVEANAELFRLARKALPKESGKYVAVKPSLDRLNLAPGEKSELALRVEIARRHHIQSAQPLQKNLVRCDVFLEPAEGISLGEPRYPQGKLKKVPYLGDISVYTGVVDIRIPFEVEEDAMNAERIAGIFAYQACNETGTCFPPDAVSFSLPLGGKSTNGRAAATGSISPGSAADPDEGERHAADSEAAFDPAAKTTDRPADASAGSVVQPEPGIGERLAKLGLIGQLIACFLYGLFINATPCVLPLLSIKVLGFVQQAHASRGRTLALGLSFGAGVLILFVALGFLAAAGKNVLQYPVAVIALGTVVTVMALSMLGVYTLRAPAAASKLDSTIPQEGLLSSFGKGALAPVLGFACTGPLLAGAFGWATQQPPSVAILAFLAAGLGMAFPYMLLGANPKWLSFLPKPGPWMITFERIMGFLLLAMVIWLISPLEAHLGHAGFKWTLIFLVGVAMACWLVGRVEITMPDALKWRYRGSAAAVAIITGLLIYGWISPLSAANGHGGADVPIGWYRWSPEGVAAAVESGKTVFVDFTAAYCTNCKVNKAVAIDTPEVRAKMDELGVVAFQADFTTGDPVIFETLKSFGRTGVPLNLIYPPYRHDEPIVLGTTLSKPYLLAELDRAGPSRNPLEFTFAPLLQPDTARASGIQE